MNGKLAGRIISMASYLHTNSGMEQDISPSYSVKPTVSWLLIGAVVVLFPWFAYMTYDNVQRFRNSARAFLLEKGLTAVHSAESIISVKGYGTDDGRNGSMLDYLAAGPGILYISIFDTKGALMSHSGLAVSGYPSNTGSTNKDDGAEWTIGFQPGIGDVFEIKKYYSFTGQKPANGIIIVGLDMKSVKRAEHADIHHTIVMAVFLFFIICCGILLLFQAHSYRIARRTLSRIRAFTSIVVDNTPMGLAALNKDKTIITFNPIAETILGKKAGSVIGKAARDVLPEPLSALTDTPGVGRTFRETEISCIIEDKIKHLETNVSILEGDAGRFSGFVLLFRDVTEIRILKKEIERNKRLAAIGNLAAGVAHEIRNPLSAIKGFAVYFRDRYEYGSNDKNIAQLMIDETDRLNRVVTHLLELSRPVNITGLKIDPAEMINDTLKLVESPAADKHIAIETHFPDAGLFIRADRDGMYQVLLNLYLNAIESMSEAGSGIMTVSVLERRNRRQIEIRVKDTGPGIREEDAAHVFDPYFTTRPAGTGLGLSVAHNIVSAHKGLIRFTSEPGEGSTVSVFLPLPDES